MILVFIYLLICIILDEPKLLVYKLTQQLNITKPEYNITKLELIITKPEYNITIHEYFFTKPELIITNIELIITKPELKVRF